MFHFKQNQHTVFYLVRNPYKQSSDIHPMITQKISVVLDKSLATGVALNTCAHMLASLGSKIPQMIGKQVTDKSGFKHAGIPICANVILKADNSEIKKIVESAKNLTVVDCAEECYTTQTDQEYVEAVSNHTKDTIKYIGVALFGEKKEVDKFTKNLSLWK